MSVILKYKGIKLVVETTVLPLRGIVCQTAKGSYRIPFLRNFSKIIVSQLFEIIWLWACLLDLSRTLLAPESQNYMLLRTKNKV